MKDSIRVSSKIMAALRIVLKPWARMMFRSISRPARNIRKMRPIIERKARDSPNSIEASAINMV